MSKRRRNKNVTVNNEFVDDISEDEVFDDKEEETELEKKEGVGSKIGGFFQKIKKPVLIGVGACAAIAGAFALGRITAGSEEENNGIGDDNDDYFRPVLPPAENPSPEIETRTESVMTVPDVTIDVTSE